LSFATLTTLGHRRCRLGAGTIGLHPLVRAVP